MASADTPAGDKTGKIRGLGFTKLKGLKPETDETVVRAFKGLSREFETLKLRMAQLSGAPEISPLQEQKLKEVVWAVLEGRPVPAALHALQDGGTLVKETQGVPEKNQESGSCSEKRTLSVEREGDQLKRDEAWQQTGGAKVTPAEGEKTSASQQVASPFARLGAVLMTAAFGPTHENVRDRRSHPATAPFGSVTGTKTADVAKSTLRPELQRPQAKGDSLRATQALALEEGTLERHRQRGNLRLRQAVPMLEGRLNKFEYEFGERLAHVEESLKRQHKAPSSTAGSPPPDGLVSLAHFKVVIGSLQHQIDSLSTNQVGLRSEVDQLSEVCTALQSPSAQNSDGSPSQYANSSNASVTSPKHSAPTLGTQLEPDSEQGDERATQDLVAERVSVLSRDGVESPQSLQGIVRNSSPLAAGPVAAGDGVAGQRASEVAKPESSASFGPAKRDEGETEKEKPKVDARGGDVNCVQTCPEPCIVVLGGDARTPSSLGSGREKTDNRPGARAHTNAAASVDNGRRSHYYSEENSGGTLLAQGLRSISGFFVENTGANGAPTSGKHPSQAPFSEDSAATGRADADPPGPLREQEVVLRSPGPKKEPVNEDFLTDSRTAAPDDYGQRHSEMDESSLQDAEKDSSAGSVIVVGHVVNAVSEKTDSERETDEKQHSGLPRSQRASGEGAVDGVVSRALREAKREREERIHGIRPFDLFRAFLNCTAR